jgi:hypothetical protein
MAQPWMLMMMMMMMKKKKKKIELRATRSGH